MQRLLADMDACMQTPTQSVLAHGRSVVLHYSVLMDHLRHGSALPEWWRLPEWTRDARLLDGLPSDDVMREYHEFHDCGKPYCRVVDEAGRVHYPGHAAMSEQVWLAVGGSPRAAGLMARDMDAHLLKADGLEAFAANPDAITLLLTAIAEVHSNAAMFGGTDSDGFKIKMKSLDKRGGAVIRLLQSAVSLPTP